LHAVISPPRARRSAFAGLAALVLATLAPAADEPGVREYVDETTAASITVTLNGLVFARERTDLAVNARDYITLAPIEVNRTGKRRYFWTGYVWSTIDRRGREPLLATGDRFILMADGRPIELQAEGNSLRDTGISEPPIPRPVRVASPMLFRADPDVIAYVGHAADLHVELVRAGASDSFFLWQDRREQLRAFSEHIAAN
jgi:hypothetical protein